MLTALDIKSNRFHFLGLGGYGVNTDNPVSPTTPTSVARAQREMQSFSAVAPGVSQAAAAMREVPVDMLLATTTGPMASRKRVWEVLLDRFKDHTAIPEMGLRPALGSHPVPR